MQCCRITSKLLLSLISLIYWGVAAALVFISVWIFMRYDSVEQLTRFSMTCIPAAILMGAGFFMFILGIVGCVAAYKESRCLLATFFTLILVIFLGMIVAAVMAYVYRQFVKDIVNDGFQRGINDYGKDKALTNEIDFVQSNLHCCGSNNYTDWHDWSGRHGNNGTLPSSCCAGNLNVTCNLGVTFTEVYKQGCVPQLHSWLMKNLAIILSTGASLAVIQFLGLLCTCVLFCHQTKDNPYSHLIEDRGYRV